MGCSKCNHIGSCGNSAVQILCHEVLHKKATSRTRPNCRRVLCNAASTEKSVFGEAFWEEIDRIPQDRQLEDRWYQRLLRGARWAMLEWVEVTLFRRKPLASPKITLFFPLNVSRDLIFWLLFSVVLQTFYRTHQHMSPNIPLLAVAVSHGEMYI